MSGGQEVALHHWNRAWEHPVLCIPTCSSLPGRQREGRQPHALSSFSASVSLIFSIADWYGFSFFSSYYCIPSFPLSPVSTAWSMRLLSPTSPLHREETDLGREWAFLRAIQVSSRVCEKSRFRSHRGMCGGVWGLDLSGFLLSQLSHHKITLAPNALSGLHHAGIFFPPRKIGRKMHPDLTCCPSYPWNHGLSRKKGTPGPHTVVFTSHLCLGTVWLRTVLGKVRDNENAYLSAPFCR